MSEKYKKGFSFIKCLLALLVIGAIVIAVLPRFLDTAEKSQMAEALMMGEALDNAMADYVTKEGAPKGKVVEFFGTEANGELDIALDLRPVDPRHSASKDFKYQAWCGERDEQPYCSWWVWSLDKGYSLYHDGTKGDDYYECWIRNDEGEAFCKMLEAQDWIVEDDR